MSNIEYDTFCKTQSTDILTNTLLEQYNMRNSILYYPHIEFQNMGWLKSSLLLWDHVYRIVPESYQPQDNHEIEHAADLGIVRSVDLDENDIRGFSTEFTDFVEQLPFQPAGLEYDEIAYLHPEKVDSHLYPFLEQYATGESNKGFIELPKEIVRGYMFFLANQVAGRRGLSRCTDDIYSFAVSSYFSEDANFDELLYDREAEGFYSSLILNDLLPLDIEAVPMDKIIKAISNSKDERVRFREELAKFSGELHRCESNDHAQTILNDYKQDLIKAKNEIKAAQGFLNKDDVGSVFTMGLPTSLTAYGALFGATGDPFGIYTLSSSLLIGAIAAYQDYKKTKSLEENNCGAAYLISLDKQFSGTGTYPAFDRYLEEFVND